MRRNAHVPILVAVALLASGCFIDLDGLIGGPIDGQIVDTPTVVVSGQLPEGSRSDPPHPDEELSINGIVAPIAPDGSWSVEIPVDTGTYVTMVELLYYDTGSASGNIGFRERQAVVHGPKLDEGQYSPDGVGLRFNNTGIAGLGPVIEGMAAGAFDIEPMLLASNPLFTDNFDMGIATVPVTGNAYEAGFDTIGLVTTSTAGGMATNVDLANMYVGLDLDLDWLGTCKLEVNIANVAVDSTFDLEPGNPDPTYVDVRQNGAPVVTTTGLTWDFISGVCDPDTFLIGSLVNSLAGPAIEGSIDDAFTSSLADPDGSGPADSPIAAAIESALGGLSIAGEVGAALGVNLDAPFTAITEDAAGLTLKSNADFFASTGTGPNDCDPPAHAPDPPSTFDVPSTMPTLGATTPGGLPYGLGLSISASAFNQLLGAMAECGGFNQVISALGEGPEAQQITSDFLAMLVPEFANVMAPGTPLQLRIRPTTAPFLTDSAGPSGEMGELVLANFIVEVVNPDPNGGTFTTDDTWLSVAIDTPLGFGLSYDEAQGVLVPTITASPEPPNARVVKNFVNADEAQVEGIFEAVFPMLVESLGATFAAFPIPSFLGMQMELVELSRMGNSFVLFTNLDPTPQTRLENVVLTGQSDGDYEEDDAASDSQQWRSRIRKTTTDTSIATRYRAVIGADACCFADDEEIARNGGYRLEFDVIPENGDTWQTNIAHAISGAHTGFSDGAGDALSNLYNPSGFSQAVVGRVSTNNGASWTQFGFNPSDLSMNRSSTGQEQFSGSNATTLQGTTNTHVIVEFKLRMRAKSESYGLFSSCSWSGCAGDEAAIRLGLNDTLSNDFTAGEYPGIGSRNVSNDGYFGAVTLTTLP